MNIFKRIGETLRKPSSPQLSPEEMAQESERLLITAQSHEKSGELDIAIKLYKQASELDPDLGRAHFLLGTALLEQGNAVQAIECYLRALTIKPDSVGTHFNLGNAYRQLSDKTAQISAYRKAIDINPEFADAQVALAVVLQESGEIDAAERHLRRALEIKPNFPGALYNLATLLSDKKAPNEAIETLRKAVEIDPDYAEAHRLLGDLLLDIGAPKQAEAHYRNAVRIRPSYVEALNNLGATLKQLGDFEEAVTHYRKALEFSPQLAEAHNNLGIALKSLGRLEESQLCFVRALEINSEFSVAHANLGIIHLMFEQYARAIECCKSALALEPLFAQAENTLGAAYQASGMLDLASEAFARALDIEPTLAETHNNLGNVRLTLGDYEGAAKSFAKTIEIEPDHTVAHSNLIFARNFSETHPPEQLLNEAKEFGVTVDRRARAFNHWKNTRNPNRQLRIGFVSGDFNQHPVGFFLEGMLTELADLDGNPLVLVAYYNHWRIDPATERLRAHFDLWHSVYPLSDEQLVDLIRSDEIDILIDLSGHTGKNRLPAFAWKPAPIQVSWLGYFATTGLKAIDYLVADPWTLPESEELYFTETIWRLPETRLCFTPPEMQVNVSSLPALKNGYVTFGCFNNLSKLTDEVLALWSSILKSIPNSRLYLKAKQMKEASVRATLTARFEKTGITSDRLILEPPSFRSEYLEAYNNVDIALDPFPYTGGTTTVEALWMGVPVLTLAGKRFLGRQGVGLLMNAGLADWVASDKDDYLTTAIRHAGDIKNLASLRSQLRRKVLSSPIFEAEKFAVRFEQALRGMWQIWCKSPDDLNVAQQSTCPPPKNPSA